jgi:hypothetical protein
VRIHDTSACWLGTTSDGENFIVEGFPEQGQNLEYPDTPGSDNIYSGDPVDPEDSFTGLDVCVPDLENSIPRFPQTP